MVYMYILLVIDAYTELKKIVKRGNDVVPATLILCAGVLHIGFLFMCLPLD